MAQWGGRRFRQTVFQRLILTAFNRVFERREVVVGHAGASVEEG
jgi:hypothetical protein